MLTQRGNEGVRYMLLVPAGIAQLDKNGGNKKLLFISALRISEILDTGVPLYQVSQPGCAFIRSD